MNAARLRRLARLLPTLFAACTHSDAPNADPPSETTDPAVTESSGPATSSGEPSTESSGDQTTTSNESTVDSTGAGVDTLPSAADDEIFAVQSPGRRMRVDGPAVPARTRVVFGKPDGGLVEVADIGDDDGGFDLIPEANMPFPTISAAGDVDGDGLADVLVADSYLSTNASTAGRTYVVFGKAERRERRWIRRCARR